MTRKPHANKGGSAADDMPSGEVHPLWEFICQRLGKTPLAQVSDGIKWAVLDLVRSKKILLGKTWRQHIARKQYNDKAGFFEDDDPLFSDVHPTMEFISQRLWKVPPSETDCVMKRAVIDLLRSDMPLDTGPTLKPYLADELEVLWFKTAVVQNTKDRLREAAVKRYILEYLVSSKSVSPPEARRIFAGDDATAEALRKELEREEEDRSDIRDLMSEKGVSETEAIKLLVALKAEARKRGETYCGETRRKEKLMPR